MTGLECFVLHWVLQLIFVASSAYFSVQVLKKRAPRNKNFLTCERFSFLCWVCFFRSTAKKSEDVCGCSKLHIHVCILARVIFLVATWIRLIITEIIIAMVIITIMIIKVIIITVMIIKVFYHSVFYHQSHCHEKQLNIIIKINLIFSFFFLRIIKPYQVKNVCVEEKKNTIRLII